MKCPCCQREGWEPIGDFLDGNILHVKEMKIRLTATEKDIFLMLRANLGYMVSTGDINTLWPEQHASMVDVKNNITVHVSNLRKKLAGIYAITSVPGSGYRMGAAE